MKRKKFFISLAAVFVVWSVLDFLIHELLLGALYDATAYIWRPRPEQMMSIITLATLLSSAAFAWIFAYLTSNPSLTSGLKFGAAYGLAVGSVMALSMYAVLPIPFNLCAGWLLGHLAKGVAAGVVAGAVFESDEIG